jgi:hypothetical protein
MSEQTGPATQEWVLREAVRVTVTTVCHSVSEVLVERLELPGAVLLTLSGSDLLFNGQRVETEDFMAYLGIFDHVYDAFGENIQVGSSILMDADSGSDYKDGEFMRYVLELDFTARMAAGAADGDVLSTVSVLRDLANAIEDPGSVAELATPITRVPAEDDDDFTSRG